MDGGGGDRCHRRVGDGAGGDASPSTPLERSCNMPTVSAMYGPQGWADLPDALLHSVASLLISFRDLLAFAATCPAWRAAFISYPSESGFSSHLPPLLLQPDVPLCSPRPRPYRSNLMFRRPCYVTNLAIQNMSMCCQIPRFCHFGDINGPLSPLDKFLFICASYGHLILSNKQLCHIVDVFTGACVSSPQLPVDEDKKLYYATLTAPLASPNSYLMVSAGYHNFFWHVGSHSWVSRFTRCTPIDRVVVFKGQVFGMDNVCRLFIVHLVPNIHIQKIAVYRGQSMRISSLYCPRNWLVVCGDMLLMVRCPRCIPKAGDIIEAFCLDLSTEPAKFVKVKKLENWAIFISTDDRSQALYCMDPERWGGRSNCIYCYGSKEWITCELGKPLQRGASTPRFECRNMMQPMWVVPSMFYPCS